MKRLERKRLNLNLPKDVVDALEELASARSTSSKCVTKSDIIVELTLQAVEAEKRRKRKEAKQSVEE